MLKKKTSAKAEQTVKLLVIVYSTFQAKNFHDLLGSLINVEKTLVVYNRNKLEHPSSASIQEVPS